MTAVTDDVIDWTQCEIVERVIGRLSGVPVLRNTRLPVDAILANYDAGLDAAQVAEIYEIPLDAVVTILRFRERQLAYLA